MLNKTIKVLLNGDKVVRDFSHGVERAFVDQLAKPDLTLEEREQLAKGIKDLISEDEEHEEENAKFYYKYGLNKGELRGMIKAVGALYVGFVIGTSIRNK